MTGDVVSLVFVILGNISLEEKGKRSIVRPPWRSRSCLTYFTQNGVFLCVLHTCKHSSACQETLMELCVPTEVGHT